MSNEQQIAEDTLASTDQTVDESALTEQSTETVVEQDNASEDNVGLQETDDFDALADQFNSVIDASLNPPSAEEQEQPTEVPPQNEQVQQPQQPQQPSAGDTTKVDIMYQAFQQDLQRKASEDIDRTVALMQDNSPALKNINSRHVRGILEQEAKDDPRINKAFMHRHLDPKAWDDMAIALAKRIQSEYKAMPDEAATTGTNALRQSVNSQSGSSTGSAFTDQQIADMPTAEFQRRMRNGEFG